jgi:hypothetical protein
VCALKSKKLENLVLVRHCPLHGTHGNLRGAHPCFFSSCFVVVVYVGRKKGMLDANLEAYVLRGAQHVVQYIYCCLFHVLEWGITKGLCARVWETPRETKRENHEGCET